MTEDPRTMKNLLTRGNTMAVAGAATIDLVLAGRRDPDLLEELSVELKAWSADVRAVASEQMP